MAGGNNQFSFEESAQTEIINTYQTALEEIKGATDNFIAKVVEQANNTHYNPIVRLGITCIDFYHDSVKQSVETLFENWADDNDGNRSSLKAFIESMDPDNNDALATAEALQSKLGDTIETMFNVQDESELQAIDVSDPHVRSEDFDTLKDSASEYEQAIEEIKSQTESTINSQAENNSAFKCIAAPVTATCTVVIESFKEIAELFTKVKDDFDQHQQELSSAADDAMKAAESAAATAAQDILQEIVNDFKL
jgi:hypothetical protein